MLENRVWAIRMPIFKNIYLFLEFYPTILYLPMAAGLWRIPYSQFRVGGLENVEENFLNSDEILGPK